MSLARILDKITKAYYRKELTQEELEEKYLNKIPMKIYQISEGSTDFILRIEENKDLSNTNNRIYPHEIYPKKGFVRYSIKGELHKDIEVIMEKRGVYILKHRTSEFPHTILYYKKPFWI